MFKKCFLSKNAGGVPATDEWWFVDWTLACLNTLCHSPMFKIQLLEIKAFKLQMFETQMLKIQLPIISIFR